MIFDEYAEENYAHLLEQEKKTTQPDPSMIDIQPEIQWYMRPYLLDFLIDCHYSLRLQQETLFFAISLLDRYCSARVVYKRHYQLVGCTALWIAAKFLDKKSRVPTLSELAAMCCSAYDEDMFVQMESHVLSTLEWNVSSATVPEMVAYHTRNDSPKSPVYTIANYLAEITLYDREFVGRPASQITCSCLLLARLVAGMQLSINMLCDDQVQLANRILAHAQNPSKSLIRKYSQDSAMSAYQAVRHFVATTSQLVPAIQDPVPQMVPGMAPPTPPQSPRRFAIGKVPAKAHPDMVRPAGHCITPPLTPESYHSVAMERY